MMTFIFRVPKKFLIWDMPDRLIEIQAPNLEAAIVKLKKKYLSDITQRIRDGDIELVNT